MVSRISGGTHGRAAAEIPRGIEPASHSIIMGIDPSLRATGYGVIALRGSVPALLAEGVVKCPVSWERSRCLVRINQELRTLIDKWRPTVCIVEGLFHARNLRTAIVMGEARGAGLAAVGEAGLEVYEIAPRRVKQAMVGYGGAGKLAVAKMVQRILGLDRAPEPDAADALALALTYVQEQGRFSPKALKRI